MAKIDPDAPVIPIYLAADIADVTMRRLEEYDYRKIICPKRDPGTKTRMYSKHDINKILFIKYLKKRKGITLIGAKLIFQILEKYPGVKDEFFSDYKGEWFT
jgi:MerR family transcriptional regulator/heat shock protein HspR